MSYLQDLDAQSASVFEQMNTNQPVNTTNLNEFEKVKIEREGYLKIIPAAGEPEHVHRIIEREINLPHGKVPIRIYFPNGKSGQPVLVYFHGGGFISGSFETHEQMMCYLANHADVTIVSVGYRLAPENKYPAAIDDAFEAMKWVSENTSELNADPSRIAIGGDSAGGTLSAIVSSRACKESPFKIVFQLLFNPALDATMSSNSWTELGDKGYIFTTDKVKQFYKWYLPDNIDQKDPFVSPLFTTDFKDLPSTFIITASADPFKDEGEAYARKLHEAGVKIEHREYKGVMHGFYQMSGVLDTGKTALKDAALALKKALH